MTTTPSPVAGPPTEADLRPGSFTDSDHQAVRDLAADVTRNLRTDRERAVALFTEIRDRLRYDPYGVVTDLGAYRASALVDAPASWCVPKATLLTATARAVGIPARLGFADVKNHLSTPKLRERMGSDLFIWHGYSQLWLDGAWRKASPAFNAELCARFDTPALEFDGEHDALLHAYDRSGNAYMEYVNERGTYRDAPMQIILDAIADHYGWFADHTSEPRP